MWSLLLGRSYTYSGAVLMCGDGFEWAPVTVHTTIPATSTLIVIILRISNGMRQSDGNRATNAPLSSEKSDFSEIKQDFDVTLDSWHTSATKRVPVELQYKWRSGRLIGIQNVIKVIQII
eukprot:354132_1